MPARRFAVRTTNHGNPPHWRRRIENKAQLLTKKLFWLLNSTSNLNFGQQTGHLPDRHESDVLTLEPRFGTPHQFKCWGPPKIPDEGLKSHQRNATLCPEPGVGKAPENPCQPYCNVKYPAEDIAASHCLQNAEIHQSFFQRVTFDFCYVTGISFM